MSTELQPVNAATRRSIRPPIGLRISIGEIVERDDGVTYPKQVDHFRFAEGQLGQYADAAAKANEIYGAEPKQIDDLYFLSNVVADVLEIRLKCWSKTGLRGVGLTNFAALPEDDFLARVFSFEDDFLFFPRDVKEVRPENRETWEGEPVEGRLEGPDDKRIAKLGIKVEATLLGCLPRVMGFGPAAQFTTASKRTIKNLYRGVHDNASAFGALINIPFRLTVRPARGQRFDRGEKKYVAFNFFEVLLDTPLTIAEIFARIRERQSAIGLSDRLTLEAQSRVAQAALGLPLPSEEVRTREEPELVERPTDAQLNRIALLEQEYAGDLTALLKGAYDVDSAEELSPEQAAMYEATLSRLVEERAEPVAVEDVEVVGEGDETGSWFEGRAEEAQRKKRS